MISAAGRAAPAKPTRPARRVGQKEANVVDLLREKTATRQKTGAPDQTADAQSSTGVRVSEAYGRLPLRFEINRGQTDTQVKFLARGGGYNLFLTPTEAVLVLGGRTGATVKGHEQARATVQPRQQTTNAVLRMKLKNANPQPAIVGLDELSSKSNYLIGNDPDKWQVGVANYERVKYAQVYPGVDMIYYGNSQQLEHDFVVAPGADVRAIRLGFAGARGLRVNRDGELILRVPGGELRQSKPVAYQEIAGTRRAVASRYVLKGGQEIGFEIGDYDRSQPLIIDPVLVYSTYLGGSGNDSSNALALDSAGNAYVTGVTASTNFPTRNALQTTNRGSNDVFVTKLNASGNAIIYSTYIGGTVNRRVSGSGDDQGKGIAVDAAGNAYVTGFTSSSDFPVAGTLRPTYGGGTYDAFVFKLNATGATLAYSAYLGGSLEDEGNAIAIDASGNAYVTGYTVSTNFPTATPFQAANAGGAFDAFVTKVNAAGSAFVYSTYLGGNSGDKGNGIAVDASGNAYITGSTPSTNFPVANAFQPFNSGPEQFGQSTDAFITKFNPAGTALVYSTYLGGNIPHPGGFYFASDTGLAIAVDSAGSAYVAGSTGATDFPVTNAYQYSNPSYNTSAFVTKLSPSGSSLIYSTYLGGDSPGDATSIAVNSAGQAHVAGWTLAANFPVVNALQSNLRTNPGGGIDPFITKLSSAGSSLVYSTYLGGFDTDQATGIALDSSSNAYVTGFTYSADFPTSGAAQATNAGGQDAFILKIADVPGYSISGRISTFDGQSVNGATVTLSGTQSATTLTDSSGNYSFANLAQGGTFTVTPSLAPYTFVPPNQTFTNLSANQTANFTIETYSIQGRVTDASGNGVAGVTMTVSGSASATGVTNANGDYGFINFPQGSNVTITPSKTDIILTYTFTPASRSYTNLNSNQVANFTSATSIQSTLNPVADAHVQDGAAANTNFGTATLLNVRTDSTVNSGANQDTYLKFDLGGVNSSVTNAKLRIYAALSAAGSVATSVYSVSSTNWIESGTGAITWNNKPARSATALTGATATINSTTYALYDIDVTAYVQSEKTAGRDVISLALHDPTATTITTSLNSREAATNKPQLIVTTGNNAAPTVSLTAPANGANFTAPANITVSANASDSDGTISKVEFFAGTTLIGTATASPYQIIWSNIATGSYTLTAVATDNLGVATRSGAVNITVNQPNNLPTVSMASPVDGTSFAAGSSLTVSANASDSDGTISKVEFFAGTTLIGTATTPASGNLYSITWSNIGSGSYALTAKATDNAGGATTSAATNISVVSQTGLAPTADAYVKDGTSATANFGTATDLQAQVSATAGNNRETYLKYDLTTVSSITQAKVRLYGRLNDTSASNVNAAIYSVATTSWTETGITWNTRPAAGASPLATVTITNNVAQWYEWDVTAYVKSEKAAGRNVVSFVVRDSAAASTFTTFNSKEATTNRPQLALRTTQPRNVLFVTNSTTLGTGDAAIQTRLQNLGFTVTVKAAGSTTKTAVNTADADGKALVVISSSVTPANVANKFRNVAVPVVIWEFDLLDDQGMTGTVSGTDFGTTTTQTQLSIVNATQPMAAGLSGTVNAVTAASTFTWGKPNTNAVKIATLTSDATKFVIFGYDAGATMPGLEAPARRVALFMSDTTAASFTANGGALFDAAIKWAVDTNTAPTINSLTPALGPTGTSVTISGVNFGATQGTSTITFNGVAATPTSWSERTIVAAVPAFATTGPVVVTVSGVASNGLVFAIGETDTDGDGLPDNWEMQYFGNLNQGANDDPDGDGVTNLQEYQQGRNPTKSALADNGDYVNLKIHTPLRP